jgi:PAS domain S-box-containing protein
MKIDPQELYVLASDQAPAFTWISGEDPSRIYFNRRWIEFTGRPAEALIGQGWVGCLHPDDRDRYLTAYSDRFERRSELKEEYRLLRADCEFRWMHEIAVPFFHSDGSFGGYVGSGFDITESRNVKDALSRTNSRMIEAQEQERARIARELHDDIGSSLAILGIEMLRAGRPISGMPGHKHPGIKEVHHKLREISARLSSISHQLNPPTLSYIGLSKALESECQAFSEKRHVPVSWSCNEIPTILNPMVALTYLRVVQEALHNIARHSGATTVTVNLTIASDLITLQIMDDGIGFDVEQSRLAAGLGLIGMQERMRLIGGEFEILSQPGKGTRISCRTPLTRLAT